MESYVFFSGGAGSVPHVLEEGLTGRLGWRKAEGNLSPSIFFEVGAAALDKAEPMQMSRRADGSALGQS